MMKAPRIPVAVSALAIVLVTAVTAEAQCDPDGDVEFVCGPVSPEDLVPVPDDPWVIVAGMEDDGYLYATHTQDHHSVVLYPKDGARSQPDPLFADCGEARTDGFRPHGLSLRAGDGERHTLYVVRHGAREAIEVFTVETDGPEPQVTWSGCVNAPEGVAFNSVTALPGTGFAATQFTRPLGRVWEWQSSTGWEEVPGSETDGPNGLVSSPDGRWLYIGGWGTQSLIRVSRGETPAQVDSVDVGFHIDNVRWAPDGSLLAAGQMAETPESIFQCLGEGQCEGVTSRVARVDPDRLTAQEIVRYPSTAKLRLGTVALQVGDEIWLGGIAGVDRIARFAVP